MPPQQPHFLPPNCISKIQAVVQQLAECNNNYNKQPPLTWCHSRISLLSIMRE